MRIKEKLLEKVILCEMCKGNASAPSPNMVSYLYSCRILNLTLASDVKIALLANVCPSEQMSKAFMVPSTNQFFSGTLFTTLYPVEVFPKHEFPNSILRTALNANAFETDDLYRKALRWLFKNIPGCTFILSLHMKVSLLFDEISQKQFVLDCARRVYQSTT